MIDRQITNITRHFIPAGDCRVLGIQLPDFTLWHWQQLAVYDLPYATLEYGRGIEELELAVQLCSLEPFTPVCFKRGLFERIERNVRLAWYRESFADEEVTFFEWLIYQLRGPNRWMKEGSGNVRVPAWLSLASLLVKNGFSEREAWAMRPGRARCYLSAINVFEGGADFIDDEMVKELVDQCGYSLEELGLA